MAQTNPAVLGPVEPTVRPLTDTQLLHWLRDKLEWDGRGYWLPEICIVEIQDGDEECLEPTMQEFRHALRAWVRAA